MYFDWLLGICVFLLCIDCLSVTRQLADIIQNNTSSNTSTPIQNKIDSHTSDFPTATIATGPGKTTTMSTPSPTNVDTTTQPTDTTAWIIVGSVIAGALGILLASYLCIRKLLKIHHTEPLKNTPMFMLHPGFR